MEEIKTPLTREELKEKANRLPLRPGVYIMRRKNGTVIYVGKSRALKNRVTQYFGGGGSHNLKTARMVENVADFEYILTDTDMEALALENRLIKLYKPKYNILLKDGKSYPYIKVDLKQDYPKLEFTRTRKDDGARYFGPYSGGSAVYGIIDTLRKAYGIAQCKYSFPKDIGVRACIYAQIGQCVAPCTGKVSPEEYRALFQEIMPVLGGNFAPVKERLTAQMEQAAENMQYEAAALYRDRIRALDSLRSKQKVIGEPDLSCDIFSLYTDEVCSAVGMYIVREGALTDSDSFIFSHDVIMDEEALSGFFYELYKGRTEIPRRVIVGMDMSREAADSLSAVLKELAGRSVEVHLPERGRFKALAATVRDFAAQQAAEYKHKNERDSKMLFRLAQLLGLEVYPERIEAYDISNYGSEHITGGMVCAIDGTFKKSEYRTYNIKTTDGQDDYGSMRETLSRRLAHGSHPDLILLDGGNGHVNVIRELLRELGYDIPVFGMVKDEYHKTRSLCDGENYISIANEQAVFQFVYKLQEEVHRFTVTKMRAGKSRTVKKSVLEKIEGIGPAKAKALLAAFGGLAGVKSAGIEQLCAVKGITEKDARRIKEYYAK